MGGPIIAAIAAGSFFGLVLIGVALYFLCFKKPDGESYRTNDKSHLDDEGEVSNQTVKVKAGHQDHNYHMVASTLKSENDEKKYFIWNSRRFTAEPISELLYCLDIYTL